jgi:hypothetical protein
MRPILPPKRLDIEKIAAFRARLPHWRKDSATLVSEMRDDVFLLGEIREVAARPTIEELRARLNSRPAVTPSVPPVEAIRAERDRS